jgi:hypothetical protein
MSFNWKQYCYIHKLPSASTKEDAYNHYLKNNPTESNRSIVDNASSCNNAVSYIHEIFPASLSYNKNLLFLCHTIPTPDIDSGSNRIIEILKILIKLEYKL